jgi:hypothetical protein
MDNDGRGKRGSGKRNRKRILPRAQSSQKGRKKSLVKVKVAKYEDTIRTSAVSYETYTNPRARYHEDGKIDNAYDVFHSCVQIGRKE